MTRRRATRLTRSSLATVGGLLLLTLTASPASSAEASPAGHEPRTPIEHFVFLFQENHTFDNYFGTRPGVDGFSEDTCVPERAGQPKPCVEPYWIGESAVLDLGHTETQFERQYNGGRMDGFVEANSDNGRDGALAMGYYDDRDLPYYWNIADEYVLFDRFFSSAKGGSVANHMYAVAGVPGVTGGRESIPPGGWGDIPTIFDRLEKAGVSWKFYIQNYDPTITFRTRGDIEEADRAAQVVWAPVLAYARFLDDPRLNAKIVDLDEYYIDVQNGTLPAVSYLVPSGNSEHPPGSIQAGQRLVRSLINELKRSQLWASSAFFWTYDDWGGWYDHVKPPQVDEHGYGFRVPALMVSPYAKRGYVGHETNDFTSILAFIEHNWNLEPLSERDAQANDMTEVFDFSAPARPPVILGLEREVVLPARPDTRPVYTAYGVAGVSTALLILFAHWRVSRRGRHARAVLSTETDDGVDLR
jgi:phospholipase C